MTSLTLGEAREVAYQEWADQWTATPFTFDDEENAFDETAEPWARFTVRNTGGGQETLGPETARKFLREASAFATIYTLADTGQAAADQLSQEARAIFEGRRVNGLMFTNGITREAGTDGRWKLTEVEIFFTYEEVK